MLFRQCAGGIVFHGEKVFLLQNDKKEWVLPKGIIRDSGYASEVAVTRVKDETGIDGKILGAAGETSYEFYSFSRQRPVCNQIVWFIMEAEHDEVKVSEQEGFSDGRFFPVEEAIKKITYSQDKSLVRVSYEKRKKFNQKGA
ncbi:NUDIX hydrolase [Metallumcola ferriviriculae]|uniref:NUDIX hydrolase n=1 Tax=Metallumcola ferriviriculae TaxID=3039180 RepID=A0AAU0UQ80_9FIRM|nr:NUDIX hydrolase [Desulfitibacteraceae bacterium MK1]